VSGCLPSQTVGPFFHLGLVGDGRMAGAGAVGERIQLRIAVLDGDGVPVPDALLELWQADANGRYKHPRDPRAPNVDPAVSGFGRLATGDDGACVFETIRPGCVPDDAGGWQASHVSVSVFARGLLRRLVTRVYFADDPALGSDLVLALVPAGRRPTLIAMPDAARPGRWNHQIRVQGERETVFFDL
jgi:protocatechuate 3,4-dioxygenase, alpha subunit